VIIAFLANPVSFLVASVAMMGAGWLAGWPDGAWWPFAFFVVVYLLCAWFLPWWTRPMNLWRYWRMKRAEKATENQFPTWPRPPA
jgi:antibiotic biosynthesis monooxygenase (ABM) superfamily enzyme